MRSLAFCFFVVFSMAVTGQPSRPNVVLITIDTLRADYVGCYGSTKVQTPFLDSLAADGAMFETAYCQAPMTPPSHASILTGTYPATHGLRDFTSGKLPPTLNTLAALLKKRDYQTAAFVSAFVLDSSWGLDQGFDLYYDEFGLEEFQGTNPGNVQRRAGETIDRVVDWLKTARKPFFLWVHLFDPHHDYNPPAPFKRRYPSNPYAGEVAYADSEIGRLTGALGKAGWYQDSLIIATSDHGESLGEHQEQEHGFFLYEATIRIPLIVKLPASFGVQGKKVAATAQSVDIVPTVLQALRIPTSPDWKIEGRGLLATILDKRASAGFAYSETLYPRRTFGWNPLQVYREGSYKLIDAPQSELYDLIQDPGETRNLFASNRSLAHQLQQKLRRLEQSFSATSTSTRSTVGADPERVERLGALGYVAVSQPVAAGSSGGAADPKDKIGVYNKILNGLQAAGAGRISVSNDILNQVAAANPELFIVHYSIGLNYLKLGQPEKALASFERAKRLNPSFELLEIHSARALAALGRIEEGIELMRQTIARSPAHLPARHQLALLLTRARRFAESADTYRKILQHRPDDKQAVKLLGIALVENQNFSEGAQQLNRALALGVDDAMVRNFLGIALTNLGRLDEGIASYRKALELKSDYAQARLNLSFALLRSGNKTEAVKEFQRLCQSSPTLCKQYEASFR